MAVMNFANIDPVLNLLELAGQQPVIQGVPADWFIGPFLFEVDAQLLTPSAVWLDLRAPAGRIDPQLAQIEGVVPGGGATDPKLAMLLTGVSVRLPCGVPCKTIAELARRLFLRVVRGQDTTFIPLYEAVSTGPDSVAVGVSTTNVGAEVEVSAFAKRERIARVIPLEAVMLNTDQVGLFLSAGDQLVIDSNQPIPILVNIFGAARDSNGFQRPATCRRGLQASSSEANALVNRAPGASVVLGAPT